MRFNSLLSPWLLLLPIMAGAQNKPADLPNKILLSAYMDMCYIWSEAIPAQGKPLKSTDRTTLATCAWMLHSKAQLRDGKSALPFDAWAATQPVLTSDKMNDSAFLKYYQQYIEKYSAPADSEGSSHSNEVREISARDYEAMHYGLIAAQQTSPVRLRMLRLLIIDALRDGRVDVEEYAVIRPVLYASNTLTSSGALTLAEARQALKDELAREESTAP